MTGGLLTVLLNRNLLRRDSVLEARIRRILKCMTPEERLAALVGRIEVDDSAAIQLAYGVLEGDAAYAFGRLLLERADAVTIEAALRFLMQKAGMRRTLKLLEIELARRPELAWPIRFVNAPLWAAVSRRYPYLATLADSRPPVRRPEAAEHAAAAGVALKAALRADADIHVRSGRDEAAAGGDRDTREADCQRSADDDVRARRSGGGEGEDGGAGD